MKKLFSCLVTLAVLIAAAPAWSGTVYVPLTTNVDKDGNRLETEIRITNISPTEFRSFTYYVIPANTDGTDRPDEFGEEVLLAPRASFLLEGLVEEGESAMIEISAENEIGVNSRIVSTSSQGDILIGQEVPVISSDNLPSGGETAILQGWARTESDLRTDFHLINLGQLATNCTANIYDDNGLTILANFQFGQQPLSLRSFNDVLSLVNIVENDEISALFNCDQPFYPFATTYSAITGEVLSISPSASGRSNLLPPGGLDQPIPGAVVFERPGTFHRPTVGNEAKHFDIPFPGNPTYSRIVLDMDFTHGGWGTPSSANHGIFWLNRGTRWRSNLFGYFNAFGPGTNTIKLSTNAGLAPGAIRAKSAGAVLVPGVTYHVHFEYDTVNNFYEATITQGGNFVARVTDIPTVNRINTVEENWFVVFGHERGAVGPEVPTYGWAYHNLRVQWVP